MQQEHEKVAVWSAKHAVGDLLLLLTDNGFTTLDSIATLSDGCVFFFISLATFFTDLYPQRSSEHECN